MKYLFTFTTKYIFKQLLLLSVMLLNSKLRTSGGWICFFWPPKHYEHACVLSRFSYVRLCDPMDSSSPGSSVHGILQAKILEWVVTPSLQGSFLTQGSNLRLLCLLYWQVCCVFFTTSTLWEAPKALYEVQNYYSMNTTTSCLTCKNWWYGLRESWIDIAINAHSGNTCHKFN